MTSNTPTPARPALDASELADRIERLRNEAQGKHCILSAEDDECPKTAASMELVATLVSNTTAILQALRSLADMRGALVTAEKQLVYSLTEAVRQRASNGDHVKASDIDLYVNQNTAVIAVRAALARSAP